MITVTASGIRVAGTPVLAVGDRVAITKVDGTKLAARVHATSRGGTRAWFGRLEGGPNWCIQFEEIAEIALLDRSEVVLGH
jgi:hypothetical protein